MESERIRVDHVAFDGDALRATTMFGAIQLAQMLRRYGHMAARTNPLSHPPQVPPILQPERYGLSEADLAQLPARVFGEACTSQDRHAQDVITRLRTSYCMTIGYEIDHVTCEEERDWLLTAIERRYFFPEHEPDQGRHLLERLIAVERLECLLHTMFPRQKRFSIEGCDMLIPMLDTLTILAARQETRGVVIGMAHRGRLNVLTYILGKPYAELFAEFLLTTHDDHDVAPLSVSVIGGDVKYHVGASKVVPHAATGQMELILLANPSHLEFVDGVVAGFARAIQDDGTQSGMPQTDPDHALPILIHGDASFPGQGVVAETFNLAQLAGYSVGGTIHIIVNNQLGFTSEPHTGRSTCYASDLAKGFDVPIAHVNADDPEACIGVARLAYAYRRRFGKDFLIDLVGYRRWGHNEGDDPSFTQPAMYTVIADHPTVRAQWARHLEEEGVVTHKEVEKLVADVDASMHQALCLARSRMHVALPPTVASVISTMPRTAVPVEQLRHLNTALLTWPETFVPHEKVARIMQRRKNALDEGAIDWAHAEALAIASLLANGTAVRLTGQDVVRGTFSQRHLALYDAQTGEAYLPIQHLSDARASFAVHNSPLSECATLGFEYGYSVRATDTLILWEAQFGDFANGAQVIVDQFIASGYAKWGQRSGLVLLLPHGYEGQGPEHSSGRVERFLQLAAADNLCVANCTTAAQYFHLLRRQATHLVTEPRPLILMTPKGLLRHTLAHATLDDLTDGTFVPVLAPSPDSEHDDVVRQLVLCSGKIAIEARSFTGAPGDPTIALARLEELYPFPTTELRQLIERYPRLERVVWLQEEPRNQGAWSFIAPCLHDLLGRAIPLVYCGRPAAATTAEGSGRIHRSHQRHLLATAFRCS